MSIHEKLTTRTLIRRRDVGVAGAMIIVSQFAANLQSSFMVSNEIVKFKQDFQQSLIDREQFFVRKTDLNPVLTRLDQLNEQLIKLNEKVASNGRGGRGGTRDGSS